MDKARTTNMLGKVVFVIVVAFLMLTHNREISRFIQTSMDFIWGMREVFSSNLEGMFQNDIGMIGQFFLILFLVVIVFLTAILAIVVGGLLWLALKLNSVYLLPFVLPLLMVNTRFSFSFIVRPIVWIPEQLLCLLIPIGKVIGKAFNLCVVLPLAEVISLKCGPVGRVYRIGMSLLFLLGTMSIAIGLSGIAVGFIQDRGLAQKIGSVLSTPVFESSGSHEYKEERHQVRLEANHEFWTDTKLSVQEGDVILFSATGRVTSHSPFDRSESISGPGGLEGLLNQSGSVTPLMLPREYRYRGNGYFPTNYVLDDKPMNSLIGKIQSGRPFCIGTSLEHKSKQDGTIMLAINQVWRSGAWKNNSGNLNVSIVIRRRE